METVDHCPQVSSIVQDAIKFCCVKERLTEAEFYRTLQEGREDTHSRFRYAVARGISSYLGHIDDNLESVYVYGSTMVANASSASDIDLLVKVKNKDMKTHIVLGLLDACLILAYKLLLAGLQVNINCMLDAHLIDDEDIRSRKDYASLITSFYTKPIKVWSRG